MIQASRLSGDQIALSRSTLAQRALYPVTFRVNEVFNGTNFPSTDWTGKYYYKTLSWTPAYARSIMAISFSGTIYSVSGAGAAPNIGAAVSFSSTLPASGGATLQVDNGNLIYYKIFYSAPSTTPGKAYNDWRDFQPYNYYMPANSSIYLFFLGAITVVTYSVLAKITFHLQYLNKGI